MTAVAGRPRLISALICFLAFSTIPGVDGIYGGNRAEPGEFPFAVQLLAVDYGKPYIAQCGGSLVSANVVVTAAHCVINITVDEDGQPDKKLRLRVTAGETKWGPETLDAKNGTLYTGQIRIAKHIYVHEAYNDTLEDNILNDIAILVLNYPFEVNSFVSPIEIASHDFVTHGGHGHGKHMAGVCGWGDTGRRSDEGHLLKGQVQILSELECKKLARNLTLEYDAKILGEIAPDKIYQTEDAIICASGSNKSGVCKGDSGGPLICDVAVEGKTVKQVLCGIASSGAVKYCGLVQPSIQFFTAVANFSDWVTAKIEEFNFICDSLHDFNCGNGICLPSSAHCNRIVECAGGGGGTDEINCEPCKPSQFRCTGKARCIDVVYLCDGVKDCGDDVASDELGCGSCGPEQFWCDSRTNSSSCIDMALVCDRNKDCLNSMDEFGCGECVASEFRCDNGQCVDSSQVCDERPSCRDKSDQRGCENHGAKNKTVLSSHCSRNLDLGACITRVGCIFNEDRRECLATIKLFDLPSSSSQTEIASNSGHNHTVHCTSESSTQAVTLICVVAGVGILLGLGLLIIWRDMKQTLMLPPMLGRHHKLVPRKDQDGQAECPL